MDEGYHYRRAINEEKFEKEYLEREWKREEREKTIVFVIFVVSMIVFLMAEFA